VSSVATYGLVNARVHAKRSSLLTASGYKALAAAIDLPETLNLLSRFKYKTMIERARDLSIESLERLLIREEVRQILEIKNSSRGPAREIIALMLARIDAENIKSILRAWQKHEKTVSDVIECPGLVLLPVANMLAAPTPAKFAEYFAMLPFQGAFLKATQDFDRRRSLFDIEVAIDKSLYEDVWNLTARLNKTDQNIVRRMVGIEIDLKNLDWVARIRKYYLAQISLTENSLIPNGFRLPYTTLRKMIAGGSLEDGLDKIMPGLAPTAAPDSDQIMALDRLEQFLNQALFHEANRLFLEYPLSIGSTIGYYFLIRIESRNIRTIINSKYYKLTPQAILPRLVY